MAQKKIKFVNGDMYEYEIYKLVDPHSEILKQRIDDFSFDSPPVDPRYLSISLIETMVHNYGLGLSANQVGLPYRVFVMGAENVGFACFNPVILEASGLDNSDEGCLSFPGLFIPVNRAKSIKVQYYDMNGESQTKQFDGLTARIFQHEFDHLNGKRHIDMVSPFHLDRAKRKAKSNLKKLEQEKKNFLIQSKMEEEYQKQKGSLTA